MTKIKNYNIDTDVTGSDKWVGSDVGNNKMTKNFTADKVSEYYTKAEKYAMGMNYRFDLRSVGDDRERGTITIDPDPGQAVAFSAVTDLIASIYTSSNKEALAYWNSLAGNFILIKDAGGVSNFGVYKLNSVTIIPSEPEFLDLQLTFVEGNGFLQGDLYYSITINGTEVNGIEEAPTDGEFYARRNAGWESFPPATPGGNDTEIQYNDGGAFNGSSNLTWNSVLNTLNVTGTVTSDKLRAGTLNFPVALSPGGNNNVLIGGDSGDQFENITTASELTILGNRAGTDIVDTSGATLIGYLTGDEMVSSSNNTAVGENAMRFSSLIGNNNTAIGFGALEGSSTNDLNGVSACTAIGFDALNRGATTCNNMVVVGYQALTQEGTSFRTGVVIGHSAARDMDSLFESNVIGQNAASRAIDIVGSDLLGQDALPFIDGEIRTTVAIGNEIGRRDAGNTSNVTGDIESCVLIGDSARLFNPSVSNTNQIVIGQAASSAGDNTTVIGNSSTLEAYLMGEVFAGSDINADTVKLASSYTVGSLPTGTTGQIAYVTDASAISYRAVATGGGAATALVFYDGTNWIYH